MFTICRVWLPSHDLSLDRSVHCSSSFPTFQKRMIEQIARRFHDVRLSQNLVHIRRSTHNHLSTERFEFAQTDCTCDRKRVPQNFQRQRALVSRLKVWQQSPSDNCAKTKRPLRSNVSLGFIGEQVGIPGDRSFCIARVEGGEHKMARFRGAECDLSRCEISDFPPPGSRPDPAEARFSTLRQTSVCRFPPRAASRPNLEPWEIRTLTALRC